MITFSEFRENFLIEGKNAQGVESDDKGKLHELLLAAHLHPKTTDKKLQLPDHHRAESDNPDHAGTPQQVHDKLKEKVGAEEYDKIHRHAKQTAEKIKSTLHNDHEITGVHWTSNRDTENKEGDHQKTTGIKDVNSNADLIVTTKHKKTGKENFTPISAKYGSTVKPNFKNPGIADLEKTSGTANNSLKSHAEKHDEYMKTLGYTGTRAKNHEQWKKDKVGTAVAQKKAEKAEASSLNARQTIASDHAKAMSVKSDKELRAHIISQAAPNTHFKHLVAHSLTNDKGPNESHVYDPADHVRTHLDAHTDLRAESSGITSKITGVNKKSGKRVTVASTTIKATSGPSKGIAGTFKL